MISMPGTVRETARSMVKYPQGDLAILSADVYDDGRLLGPSGRAAGARKAQASASAVRGSEEGPRKRAKTQPADAPEPEDEKKRARGRPRLDPKDETAADRRRTQIRLAQRAYRNRKETAIHTLEKRVQQLKDTNEGMSNAFMQLHDFALSSGLLDKAPEFGRQLRETTEKFLSLAREASDEEGREGEGEPKDGPGRPGRPGSDRARSDSPPQPRSGAAAAGPDPAGADRAPQTLCGGLQLSYEPVTQAGHPAAAISTAMPEQPPVSAFSYEVVTHPTLDNASFPFPASSGLDFLEDLATPSPYLSLPAPNTYSTFETTFGRRLQRNAIERALFLISMPDAPQALVNSVFGFCLLLESPATIKRRLRRALGRDVQESLHNWQYPFYHLGGAGTHISGDPAAAFHPSNTTTSSSNTTHNNANNNHSNGPRRFGNQGTLDVLKPGSTAGFATGPFSEQITAVRDDRLDSDMRMRFPGFAGEYYDCDEAEMYLYQRGVVIPPGADVVAAEIDASQFTGGGDGEDSGGGSYSSSSNSGGGGGGSPDGSTSTSGFGAGNGNGNGMGNGNDNSGNSRGGEEGTGGGGGGGGYPGQDWQPAAPPGGGQGMLDTLASLADTLAGMAPGQASYPSSSPSAASSPESGATSRAPPPPQPPVQVQVQAQAQMQMQMQMQDWSMGGSAVGSASSGGGGGGGGGMIDPSLAGVFSSPQGGSSAFMQAASAGVGHGSHAAGAHMLFPFGQPVVPEGAGYGMRATPPPPPPPNPTRQRVVVDVTRLVNELTRRGICLGRSPGFRQADINAAFWAAAQVGVM